VVVPSNITLGASTDIFRVFQERLRADTAVKMDVLATLRYLQAYLDRSEAGRTGDFDPFGAGPTDFVSGLYVAFYKDLGNSSALMNFAFLGLPVWISNLDNRQDVDRWKEVLEEHIALVRFLKEDRSEQHALLARYRDFLSGRDLIAFFDFAIGYGQLLMREVYADQYAPPLSTRLMEELIMNHDRKLGHILKNEGFVHIARAIRRSTITPIYMKGDSLYEPQFSLGADLKRKATSRDEFVIALTDFMHRYNEENARKSAAQGKQYRDNIQTSHIESLIALIDEEGHHWKTVCNMLIAYGYASEPRSKATGQDQLAPVQTVTVEE
jgi:hypothetical protein